MIILSVDTSTSICRTGLFDNQKGQKGQKGIIAEISLNLTLKQRHSQYLLDLIDIILTKSNHSLEDIDLIAIVNGPGSYTGLRVGISTVKGLAFVNNIPIIPVNALTTLAWNFPYSTLPICTTIGAKKNELHCAIYKCIDEQIIETSVKGLYKIEDLKELITEKTIIAGEAILLYPDYIKNTLSVNGIFPSLYLNTISIAAISCAAIKKLETEGFQDASTITPIYSLVCP